MIGNLRCVWQLCLIKGVIARKTLSITYPGVLIKIKVTLCNFTKGDLYKLK